MKVKNAYCRARARAVEETVEAWKVDHDDAMGARDTDELVAVYLDFYELLHECCNDAWEGLFANQIGYTEHCGRVLSICLKVGVKLGSEILECIQETENGGFEVEKAKETRVAVRHVNELAKDSRHAGRGCLL
jgi:hypothetical protein